MALTQSRADTLSLTVFRVRLHVIPRTSRRGHLDQDIDISCNQCRPYIRLPWIVFLRARATCDRAHHTADMTARRATEACARRGQLLAKRALTCQPCHARRGHLALRSLASSAGAHMLVWQSEISPEDEYFMGGYISAISR